MAGVLYPHIAKLVGSMVPVLGPEKSLQALDDAVDMIKGDMMRAIAAAKGDGRL